MLPLDTSMSDCNAGRLKHWVRVSVGVGVSDEGELVGFSYGRGPT